MRAFHVILFIALRSDFAFGDDGCVAGQCNASTGTAMLQRTERKDAAQVELHENVEPEDVQLVEPEDVEIVDDEDQTIEVAEEIEPAELLAKEVAETEATRAVGLLAGMFFRAVMVKTIKVGTKWISKGSMAWFKKKGKKSCRIGFGRHCQESRCFCDAGS